MLRMPSSQPSMSPKSSWNATRQSATCSARNSVHSASALGVGPVVRRHGVRVHDRREVPLDRSQTDVFEVDPDQADLARGDHVARVGVAM